MARVRGVHLRTPPTGPGVYPSKETALEAEPGKVIADAAFPRTRLDSVKAAAFRVNSGARTEWDSSQYFAIWEYTKDVVLRIRDEGGEDGASDDEGSVEVIGFVQNERIDDTEGRKKSVRVVVGDHGEPKGELDELLQEDGVELGGWMLLIGRQPNVPPGWEDVVSAPGSRRRRRRSTDTARPK